MSKPVFGVRCSAKRRALLGILCVALAVMVMFLGCGGDDNPGKSNNNNGQSNSGSHFNPNINYDSFTDSRDNKSYRTVVIGTQTWMAENLNFNANGSICYDNNSSNCNRYGRLYSWAAAMGFELNCNSRSCESEVQDEHRGVCPEGWHIPSHAEWTTLADYANSIVGTRLKSTSGWNTGGYYIPGTDDFGFSALPGGYAWEGDFKDVGTFGGWWSATEDAASRAFDQNMYYNGNNLGGGGNAKITQQSLRCIKD